jgi:3-isopropylmalate dehydratase small subunit
MSTIIKARAHLLPAEINTDVHCSAKYMPGKDAAYIAQHAFEQIDAGFVKRFEEGDVIVAGKNFGINSSREQAVHVMRLLGVSAVVAPAFGRQFFRNAINNGLALVECDIEGIAENDVLEIDFTAGKLKVVERDVERAFAPLPHEIQSLLAAGGLIPFLQAHPDWKIA